MSNLPVRVKIKLDVKHNCPRRPRMFKWLGYERKLAALWDNDVFM